MTGHPRNLDLGKFKLRDVRGFARPFVGCFVARAVALGVVWRPNAAPSATFCGRQTGSANDVTTRTLRQYTCPYLVILGIV